MSLLGFGFASGVVLFVAAAGGGRLLRVEGLARSARLREPRQVRAAGDDAHPCARRQPDGRVRRERRIFVPINVVPKLVIAAFLSAEDKRFYEHGGLDFTGIARAVLNNLQQLRQEAARGRLHHHPAGGQELPAVERAEARAQARRRRSSPSASSAPTRRTRSSSSTSNEIYLGMGSYGVAAAALNYFSKELSELTHRGGRLPGGPAQGAQQLPSLPQGQGGDHPARLDHRPDGRRRLHHRRRRPRRAKAKPLKVNIRPLGTQIYAADYFAEDVRRTLVDILSARMASTAAPSAPASATAASTAAFRCAPRSIPTCSAWRAGR